jgi:hypothetical protein
MVAGRRGLTRDKRHADTACEILVVPDVRGQQVIEDVTNQVVAVAIGDTELATAIIARFAAAGARVHRILPPSLDRMPIAKRQARCWHSTGQHGRAVSTQVLAEPSRAHKPLGR